MLGFVLLVEIREVVCAHLPCFAIQQVAVLRTLADGYVHCAITHQMTSACVRYACGRCIRAL